MVVDQHKEFAIRQFLKGLKDQRMALWRGDTTDVNDLGFHGRTPVGSMVAAAAKRCADAGLHYSQHKTRWL
jgi:hypothetical protein